MPNQSAEHIYHSSISACLADLEQFKKNCPPVLLGMNGNHLLEKIISDLILLAQKTTLDSNDCGQYQVLRNICDNIKLLQIEVKKHEPPKEDELLEKLKRESVHQNQDLHSFLEENYPHRDKLNSFLKLEDFEKLGHAEKTLSELQQTHFSYLHSADQLLTSLRSLQEFDPKPHGALHQLLRSLNNTFIQKDIKAEIKLLEMMHQIQQAYHAIKNSAFRPSMQFFGVIIKQDKLGSAMEIFIQKDVAHFAKLNGLPVPVTNDNVLTEHTPKLMRK